jgi:LysR family transcriptional regulator, transcriptional activator for bauABCD operon
MLGRLNDLDIRLVRVFVTIAEAGGISAAQTALNVGQSTISMQLSSLETRLGYRLCARGRGGFALTSRGKQFLEACRALLTSIDAFELQARNLDKQLVGTLRLGLIGHTPVSANARLSEAIALFRQREQAVHISIVVRPPGDLEEMLLNGLIDIGVGYFWHRVPSLEYFELFSEDQLAYCGKSHPLFDKAGRVGPNDLEQLEWAWRSYPVPENERIRTPANVTAVSDNMEAIAMLVLSGRHVGFLPEHFAKPYVQAKLLKPLNSRLLRYRVPFHAVVKQPSHRNEVVNAFLADTISVHEREQ